MDRRGQSLVEVLILIGVTGAILSSVSTFIFQMKKQVMDLSNRLVSMEVESRLQAFASDGSICDFEVTTAGAWISQVPATFDASGIGPSNYPVIPLNQILSAPNASAPPLYQVGSSAVVGSASISVASIQIRVLSGNPSFNDFPAALEVTTTGLGSQVKPVSIPIIIKTSGAGSAKTVIGCRRGGGNSRQPPKLVSELDNYHASCGPYAVAGANNDPVHFFVTGGTDSTGFLMKHCTAACDRYCGGGCNGTNCDGLPPQPGLGFGGGIMTQYIRDMVNGDRAVCVCVP